MPLYEYRCKQCGHRFEKIQSFSAEDVKQCPVCQGEVERLISAPAVQFKGSGFYSTDYGAKPAAKSSDTKGGGESGGSSAEKSPAAKTESAPATSGSSTKSE
jgi:putative FmdB family regulatory protein